MRPHPCKHRFICHERLTRYVELLSCATALLYEVVHTIKGVLGIAMSRNTKDSVYLLKAFEPHHISEQEDGRFQVPKAHRRCYLLHILVRVAPPVPGACVHLVEAANEAYQFP